MISALYIELVYIYKVALYTSLLAANIPKEKSKISFSSIFDFALPAISPIVAAGSNKCEAVKSFFGLTYEQMQEKNATINLDALNIDLIDRNGSTKFNLTATKRLSKALKNEKDLVILVHGFMESSDGIMVQALAPEYLKQSRYKILALDGRKLINLEYFRSSTYARFMGEKLGTMLAEIINRGQNPEKITIVGHSLGAHIAGIAGKQVYQLTGKLLGRITGLDPAGPCFSNAPSAGRLDRTDALYVDVIHTNAGFLGLHDPVGHKDFYPNGGMTQPRCFLSTCDHSKVWLYFAESVNSPDNFPGNVLFTTPSWKVRIFSLFSGKKMRHFYSARKCGNWTMFKDGLCKKNEVSYMGMNSVKGNPGVYYLTTAPSSPFGMGPIGSGK